MLHRPATATQRQSRTRHQTAHLGVGTYRPWSQQQQLLLHLLLLLQLLHLHPLHHLPLRLRQLSLDAPQLLEVLRRPDLRHRPPVRPQLGRVPRHLRLHLRQQPRPALLPLRREPGAPHPRPECRLRVGLPTQCLGVRPSHAVPGAGAAAGGRVSGESVAAARGGGATTTIIAASAASATTGATPPLLLPLLILVVVRLVGLHVVHLDVARAHVHDRVARPHPSS
jgi:hypothetical protein